MDAHLVWDTWRRILTRDDLVVGALEPAGDFTSLGLSPAETAILADYASTRAATFQTIFMYRSGLVRNALSALQLAQLSNGLLHTSNLDPGEVARDFTASIGYRDDGPNLWRLAAAFIEYLIRRPEFASEIVQDVLSLDAAAIALVRRLGDRPLASWPDVAVKLAHYPDSLRYAANSAAAVASTRFDLKPWLGNPSAFNSNATLDRVESHWLICLPTAGLYTLRELPPLGARIFTHLTSPKTASQLAEELDLSVADARKELESLNALGAIAIEKTHQLDRLDSVETPREKVSS